MTFSLKALFAAVTLFSAFVAGYAAAEKRSTDRIYALEQSLMLASWTPSVREQVLSLQNNNKLLVQELRITQGQLAGAQTEIQQLQGIVGERAEAVK